MRFLKYLMTPANKSGNLPTNSSQQEEDNDIDFVEEEEFGSTNTQDEEISLPSPQYVSAASVASPQEEERPSSASASSTITRNKGSRKRLCEIGDDKFIALKNKKLQLSTQNFTKGRKTRTRRFKFLQKFDTLHG
ncbi:hypothetical protein JTB14_022396 [Gonioctena quinquepunctata]|nr:hypothetical protein JTB14_022396 [Gonioctena quinquepunctata]